MAEKRDAQPTELELLILHVLWDEAPLPVREIRQRLAESDRVLAHTSVITMLNIMVDKGFLKRSRQGNAFLFAPRVARERVSHAMTQRLIDRVFRGSRLAVLQHLLDASELDEEELAQIRKLVNQKARSRR